jgi:hypothetical protein
MMIKGCLEKKDCTVEHNVEGTERWVPHKAAEILATSVVCHPVVDIDD